MFARAILSSFVLVATFGAIAEERIAMLTGVQGTVLVTKKEGMAAGVNGQALAPGARVVATSNSRATIAYSTGCDVSLSENSRTTVRPDIPCTELQSDVVLLAQGPTTNPGRFGGTAFGGAAGGAGIPPITFVILGGTSAALAYKTIEDARQFRHVSPH
jgi:hypothetical protein